MRNGENTKAVTIESVLQSENLRTVWHAVEANRGAVGVDGMDAKRTREHLRGDWKAVAGKTWVVVIDLKSFFDEVKYSISRSEM